MRDLNKLTSEERAWFKEIEDEEPALREIHEIRLWNYIETRHLNTEEKIRSVNALARKIADKYGLTIVKAKNQATRSHR